MNRSIRQSSKLCDQSQYKLQTVIQSERNREPTCFKLIDDHGDGESEHDDSSGDRPEFLPTHRFAHRQSVIVLVIIHKLVLLVRIVRRGDAIVRRLALFAQACSQGMYASTAGMRLQGVRKRREQDNSESADGDDDRSPRVPARDSSADIRVLQETFQATYMAITLLLTPCPKVRYPTIPSFVK